MPANTPNRLYPYPVAGDPVDVPGDIQRLAEAIDNDFATLGTSIGSRPFAQISSVATLTLQAQPVVGVLNQITFDTVDFDNAGLVQSSGDKVQIVIPNQDFYWMYLEIEVPQISRTTTADPFIYMEMSNSTRAYRTGSYNNTADNNTGGIAPHTAVIAGIFQQASQPDRTTQALVDFGAATKKLNFGVRKMGAIAFRDI